MINKFSHYIFLSLMNLRRRFKATKKHNFENFKYKSILIFTMSESQSWYEVKRIVKEAENVGIEAKRVLYKDLIFRNDKVFVGDQEVNKDNSMGIIFRVAGTKSGKYIEARNLLIKLLGDQIKCVNEKSYLDWPRMGKIPQLGVFLKNKIPVISTKIFYKKEDILREKWDFPIIAKDSMGFQGKSVCKIDNQKELINFLNDINEIDLGMWSWQRCLSTNWDLRIIVIGGKVIGAMKRTAVGDEFRSNFSLGGEVEKWDLSKTDKIIAENVAKSCGLDYCGVDIMKDCDGTSYVLEVNRQCQFRGFEKATGINVAKEIIKYCCKFI
jgi:RimK family alpha-L-glutamate ligase